MRKITSVLMCMLALCCTALHADNEKPIQVSQLPAAAQQFVKKHFADRKVALAKVEDEVITKSYEVVFSDGDHIDFDGKGNWEEVDCKSSSVPDAIIPSQILKHVRANYPDATVKKIEKDHWEYEVKLSNHMELSFDKKFKLKDIDM